MKCDICGTEASAGHLIVGEGFCCSEDCVQIAKERRNVFIQTLRNEPLEEMPAQLETHDFESWALKLAVHVLDSMAEDMKRTIAGANPMMLQPETLALELKDQIIKKLHKAYVSETEVRGHARMFYSGEYCFRQPVPKAAILDAAVRAQILKAT